MIAEGPSFSAILRRLPRSGASERVSVGEMVDAFGNKAFAALIFVFAMPIALPLPLPGISFVLGIPLLLLTLQLMGGLSRPWLPAALRARSFDRRDLVRAVARIEPWLARAERLVGPRLLWMTRPLGLRVIGLFAFALTIALFLPVPFGSMLPALALALLALGILERDGRLVLTGAAFGVAGLALTTGVLYGLGAGALWMWRAAVG